jgi:hypothetical protein
MWKRQPDPQREAARAAQARVKEFAFLALGQNPDIATSVNEIICHDPACPGVETVILVMAPGQRTAATKIAKAMLDVSEDDVRDAMRRLA